MNGKTVACVAIYLAIGILVAFIISPISGPLTGEDPATEFWIIIFAIIVYFMFKKAKQKISVNGG